MPEIKSSVSRERQIAAVVAEVVAMSIEAFEDAEENSSVKSRRLSNLMTGRALRTKNKRRRGSNPCSGKDKRGDGGGGGGSGERVS